MSDHSLAAPRAQKRGTNLGGGLPVIGSSIGSFLGPTGDIPRIRLISNEPATVAGVASKPSRKQAFGGVFPRKQAMPAAGIEPATDGLENRYLDSIKPIGGMGLGAGGKPVYPSFDPTNPWDLQEVVDAWATLPEAIRAGILAMVAASKPVEPPPLGAVLSNRLNTWQRKTGANPKRIRR